MGSKTLLVHNGEILQENLEHEQLNLRELHVLLRRQGVHDPHNIREAVLESNGALSLVLKTKAGAGLAQK